MNPQERHSTRMARASRLVPSQTMPYFSIRDELTIRDGVIFHGQEIVVPVSLQHDMKQKLHVSQETKRSEETTGLFKC